MELQLMMLKANTVRLESIFLFLEYLYILSYRPSNLASFKKSEILTDLLTFAEKIARYDQHKEFLQNCKVNRKNLVLKFNLSLCSGSPNLQKLCKIILCNASFLLRDNTIQIIIEKLEQFSVI